MKHYDTLNLKPGASADQIKEAYRREASRAHPDREGGSTERMQAVNEAYQVLGDEERRAKYDATGDDKQRPPLEQRAIKELVGFFADALNSPGNVVEVVRRRLDDSRAGGAPASKNWPPRSRS